MSTTHSWHNPRLATGVCSVIWPATTFVNNIIVHAVLLMVMPALLQMINQEVEELVKIIDQNSDGILSHDELSTMVEVGYLCTTCGQLL